jgi:hypothetical protein
LEIVDCESAPMLPGPWVRDSKLDLRRLDEYAPFN